MYPLKVTVRDTLKSPFLEEYIFKKAQKLNQFCQRISSCRVAIDMPQKHKHQGKLFRVSVELNVQGKELVVNRKLDEDVYLAVTHAFDAIERKLENYAHRRVDTLRRRQRAAHHPNGLAEQENGYRLMEEGWDAEMDDESFHSDYSEEYDNISQWIRKDRGLLYD